MITLKTALRTLLEMEAESQNCKGSHAFMLGYIESLLYRSDENTTIGQLKAEIIERAENHPLWAAE